MLSIRETFQLVIFTGGLTCGQGLVPKAGSYLVHLVSPFKRALLLNFPTLHYEQKTHSSNTHPQEGLTFKRPKLLSIKKNLIEF